VNTRHLGAEVTRELTAARRADDALRHNVIHLQRQTFTRVARLTQVFSGAVVHLLHPSLCFCASRERHCRSHLWSAPQSSAHRDELRVRCSVRYSAALSIPSSEFAPGCCSLRTSCLDCTRTASPSRSSAPATMSCEGTDKRPPPSRCSPGYTSARRAEPWVSPRQSGPKCAVHQRPHVGAS
jgi:hypothetical protein